MKKLFFNSLMYAVVLLIFIAGISSCKKSSADPISASSFSWTVSGVTYTADNDTAFVSGPFTIIAQKDAADIANYKIFEIDLSAFSTGAYTLTSSGDQVNYVTSAGVVTSQSGTLNITANTGTTVSGNFSTTLSGGLAMTGNFTAIPIKP